MLFCDDPKKIQILENILKTKFKSLINKQIPSAHTSQLNALTSSAATYSKTSKNWIKYIYVYNNKRWPTEEQQKINRRRTEDQWKTNSRSTEDQHITNTDNI